MNIKNLLEQTLKDKDISIYCDDTKNKLYYYVKDLGLKINLESQSLNTIDIVFSYEEKHNYRDKTHELVYTLPMSDISDYLEEVTNIYQRNKIKNILFAEEEKAFFYLHEILNFFANNPTENNYQKRIEDNNIVLIENKMQHIFKMSRVVEDKKENIYKNPLAMINIPCIFNLVDGKKIYFELAIPSYKLNQYPVLNEFLEVNKYNITEGDFLERLKNIPNPSIQSKVRSYMLDASLEKKDYTKTVRKV